MTPVLSFRGSLTCLSGFQASVTSLGFFSYVSSSFSNNFLFFFRDFESFLKLIINGIGIFNAQNKRTVMNNFPFQTLKPYSSKSTEVKNSKLV